MTKPHAKLVLVLLFVGLTWLVASLCTADPLSHVPEKVRAGVIELPPFVRQHPSGEWGGLGCDLLQAVAKELGTELELVPVASIEQMEGYLVTGKIDLVPVAIVAAGLERRMDFSNAYYQSGSAIVIHADGSGHPLFA